MNELTDLQKDILLQLAAAPNTSLPEWNLHKKGDPEYISTAVIGEQSPTLHVLRDMYLIEELPDLHCRWGLTMEGLRAVVEILLTRLDAVEQAQT